MRTSRGRSSSVSVRTFRSSRSPSMRPPPCRPSAGGKLPRSPPRWRPRRPTSGASPARAAPPPRAAPCASASESAAAQPVVGGQAPAHERRPPPRPSDWRSRANRPAMLSWMPRRMSAASRPRETMLMTSVSASTAQIELTVSGFVGRAARARPISSCDDAEVPRDVLEELAGAGRALARHLVVRARARARPSRRRGRGAPRRRARRRARAPGTARRARASSCRRSGRWRTASPPPSPVVADVVDLVHARRLERAASKVSSTTSRDVAPPDPRATTWREHAGRRPRRPSQDHRLDGARSRRRSPR